MVLIVETLGLSMDEIINLKGDWFMNLEDSIGEILGKIHYCNIEICISRQIYN